LEGHDWYAKAEKRGASKQSIDTERRGIFLRADKARRETMRASLLAKDPNRYRWVNDRSIAVNRCQFLRQSQASLSGRKLPSSDCCFWPVSASSHLFVWDNRVENGKGLVYLSWEGEASQPQWQWADECGVWFGLGTVCHPSF
jgi:hypothetical protein